MSGFFPDIRAAEGALQQEAFTRWQAMGDLRRREHWRWTPLDALRDDARRSEGADYQFDLPDAIGEDFGTFTEADRTLLALDDAAFAALNLALLPDALQLTVPDGADLDAIAALNIDLLARRLQTSRIHIRAGKNSRSAFWIDYRASRSGAQLPVITVNAEDGAQIDIALWFHGDAGTAQVAQAAVQQATDSRVRINALQAGGDLLRLDIHSELHGEGTHFAFGGVQLLTGKQTGDYHLNVRHLTENSESHQRVRGALDDAALGIFDGMIYVAHGAQKTDARQDSRYILLSDSARSHSVPRLEIYADDVQCAHGSTTGKVDQEALFYLRSRGIGYEAARKMLILSFLHEAVVVEHQTLADAVHQTISDIWLGDDEAAA